MNIKSSNAQDRKVILSTLWVFIMLNMIFADILSFLNPEFLQELLTGYAGEIEITAGFLLVAAIITEIPITMVVLSRILNYKINRWANIVAGLITIIYVIGGGSSMPHYIFIASIEVICLTFMIWYAWTWTEQ